MRIDTDRFSASLRSRMVKPALTQILMTQLEGSDQEQDLSAPTNCEGLGRIRHFRRQTSQSWPSNSLPIDPAIAALGMRPGLEEIEALVFQSSGCNWRCWYCYVPFDRLSADERLSRWVTMAELVRRYAALADRPPIIDLSGGQPELTPEMTLWTMRALLDSKLEQSCFLWSDDNLSTDYFWSELTEAEQEEIVTFKNYARVGCFKGFDAASFAFNTLADETMFERQFTLMGRYLASGMDIYGYATFTSPDRSDVKRRMAAFVDRLQNVHPNLPLRVVPLEVQVFSPTEPRVHDEQRVALGVQQDAIAAWNDELMSRFSEAERIRLIQDVPLS
jgi:uncharacterized Fe-S cluster-containing radical SAM superfamily protein